MPRHHDARIQSLDGLQRLEERARAAVHHHGHAILDQEIAGKKNPL
jgi:hypothetical protein